MTSDIEKIYEIPFAPYRVYNAWISNDTIVPPATRMDILPELGGHYRLFVEGDGETFCVEGIFQKIQQNRLLQYTWGWDGLDEISTVSIAFSPAPHGTMITLRHSGFLEEENRQKHDAGWDKFVEGFIKFLGENRPNVTH